MSREVSERPGFGALVGAGVTAGALLVLAGLLAVPSVDVSVNVPFPHFYIVSAVAVLAFLVAILLAFSGARLQHYKLLLLGIGFMAMAGLFLVHGLSTPGVLVPLSTEYGPPAGSHSVVGVSGFLSLLVPSLFFGAAYLPLLNLYERRLPFWPAGALLLVAASAVAVFGAFSFANSDAVSQLPVTSTPVIYALAALTVAGFAFAGWRQLRSYRVSGLRLQGSLALAFPLLACAELAQLVSLPWTLAWWEYHVLMLVAVALAFVALLRERGRGRSYGAILEAALDLQVRAQFEIDQVTEIAALAAAIEAKDHDTRGHTVRVAELTVAIARELNMPAPRLRYLARAGLLHDIGKLHLPDNVLLKPGPLDDEEWAIMRRHPELGLDILRRLGKFESESEVVIAHHERMDGSGYPRRLKGDEIPVGARILAVADTYDALISDRPYRRARTREEAVKVLGEESGHHLWSPAVEALVRILAAQSPTDRRAAPRTRGPGPADDQVPAASA